MIELSLHAHSLNGMLLLNLAVCRLFIVNSLRTAKECAELFQRSSSCVERCCENKPINMFEWRVENMPLPARPISGMKMMS